MKMAAPFKQFSEKQKLAMRWWSLQAYQDYDAIICDGAVRSGKTVCMSLGFVCWATRCFQETAFALCGKTITALRRNVVTPLLQTLQTLGFRCTEKSSRNYVDITLGNHSNRFYLFGGRDESSAALIQGITLGGVFLDEVALMPRTFVEQALARCSLPQAKLWFNCNPDHPYHWFYREWIQKAVEKHTLYLHFTMADNPGLTDRVRERYERFYSGIFYDRFVLGKWTVSSGVVYPMFSKERHVVQQVPACAQFYISCDYGTVNPSSFGLWGCHDGIWYRMAEYYYDARKEGSSRTDEAHYAALEALAGNRPIEAVVIDPSAASMIACIAQHGRFRVIRADNDVLAGIQRVSSALQKEQLRFAACCTDTIREFGMYCWEEAQRGDAPRKEFDHAMDDIRYFVSTILQRQQPDAFFTAAVKRHGG
jgi:PBSX family phage terminase large subunit